MRALLADRLFKNADSITHGHVELTTPDGRTRHFGGRAAGPAAHLEIRDWRVVANLATRGDIGFLEDYKAGLWESRSLEDLISLALMNEQATAGYLYGNPLFRLKDKLSYILRRNTVSGSRKNIHAHYDVGNAFYQLWLDPTMTYSSALYQDSSDDLMTAQNNKYDRIIDRLEKPSGSILEVGCGWGGFAERAMYRGDYDLKGITISQEQYDYARKRMGQKAQIAFEDYRHQEGQYDHIVSIEMFEAVGESFWPVYFSKLKSLLKKQGKAVIQTITIADHKFEKYRKGSDVIRSYIFPGGMLPSPSRFKVEVEKAGLVQSDRFDFGQDYAKTLRSWMGNFTAREKEIRALGYDDAFIRVWRFYLASCIAGFRTGRINVMQAEVQHA